MDVEKHSKPEELVLTNAVDTMLEDVGDESSIEAVRNSSANAIVPESLVHPSINRKFQSTIGKGEFFRNIKTVQVINNCMCKHFMHSFSKTNGLSKRQKRWKIGNSKEFAIKHLERCSYGNVEVLKPYQLKEKRIKTFKNQENKALVNSLVLKDIYDEKFKRDTSFTCPATWENKRDTPSLENKDDDYLVSNIVDTFETLDLTDNKSHPIYSATSLSNTCNPKKLKCGVDFTISQDNAQNIGINVVDAYDDNARRFDGEQSIKFKKRSVQWNIEVDVIYYAGDTDGGAILRRQTEPLRKEADQLARQNDFIQFALHKNMILFMDFYRPKKVKRS